MRTLLENQKKYNRERKRLETKPPTKKKRKRRGNNALHEKRWTYRGWISSKQWRRKRAKRIARAGFKCERCGRSGRLEVHHKTYDNLGQEIKTAFTNSEEKVDEAWERAIKIEINPGLDVLDEKDQLESARLLILQAIPVSHTLDLVEIKKYTDEVLAITNKVNTSIDARQEEFITRKKGLFATLVILILIIGFLLYRRWILQLELETDMDL